MLANIGVVTGVAFENETNSPGKRHAGWRMLVVSLGAEILFSSVTFAIDLEVGRRQNSQIIALRKNSIPRSIDVSAFSKRLEGAAPGRVEIQYVAACSDCESLSFWLSEALKKASWTVGLVIPIDPPDWVRVVRSLHAQSAGITFVINSPDKITADPKTSLGALGGALSQALGFNFLGYDTNVMGGVDVTMPADVIRVVIAPKA
jgi:hypothetical protein